MARLPRLDPGQLSPEQAQVYRAITTGPRSAGPQLFRLTDDDGRLEGPFNLMLYSPAVGLALQSLGSTIRYSTELSARSRELAILMVAARLRSDFEWYAHRPLALAAGAPPELVDQLGHGGTPAGSEQRSVAEASQDSDTEQDVLVATMVDQMLSGSRIDVETYQHAVDSLGERSLVELVILVGYYWTLASAMSVFDVGLPAGEPPVWEPRPGRSEAGHE